MWRPDFWERYNIIGERTNPLTAQLWHCCSSHYPQLMLNEWLKCSQGNSEHCRVPWQPRVPTENPAHHILLPFYFHVILLLWSPSAVFFLQGHFAVHRPYRVFCSSLLSSPSHSCLLHCCNSQTWYGIFILMWQILLKNGKKGFFLCCLILLLMGKAKTNSIKMSNCHFVLLIPSKLFRTLGVWLDGQLCDSELQIH